MKKKSKVQQVYGYIICIVAVITTLISIGIFIDNYLDYKNPLYSWGYDKSLSSFENYKMEVVKNYQADSSIFPDNETLEQMFEDAKNQKIHSIHHQSSKTMIVNLILIIISVVLFTSHWIWLKRINNLVEG